MLIKLFLVFVYLFLDLEAKAICVVCCLKLSCWNFLYLLDRMVFIFKRIYKYDESFSQRAVEKILNLLVVVFEVVVDFFFFFF